MKNHRTLPELLAPAGSMEALYAAVECGADAVYLGGKLFSARANARNFDADELRRAVRYCHLWGVKVYVTVNILLPDREMDEAVEFCRFLAEVGTDAAIVADVGLMRRLQREVPALTVHASTQFSAHSKRGAEEARLLGATRCVPARELSLSNIKTLVEEGPLPAEIFLHGALCVCHSGQCLFSSLVGGRSGNRGECAQPCRLPYQNGKHLLSLKDLCLAEHIPEIIESGVCSLKIEGRMKAPAYVGGVCRIYRRLLDEGRAATAAEMEALSRLFSRDGFTDGYFTGRTERGMTGMRSEQAKAESRTLNEETFAPKKAPIAAALTLREGEECTLTLTLGDVTVTARGDTVQTAKNAALTEETLLRAVTKLGDTDFSLREEDVSITTQGCVFLPMGALNALRRRAVEMLTEHLSRPLEPKTEDTRLPAPVPAEDASKIQKTAVFYDYDVWTKLGNDLSLFDLTFVPLFAPLERGEKIPDGVVLPVVIPDSEEEEVLRRMKEVRRLGVTWALIGNVGQISLAREADLIPFGDFRLNVTNRDSLAHYGERGVAALVASPELTLPRLRDLRGTFATIYGRIPLMITERCFVKENGGCEKCGKFTLRDRTGAEFPILREWRHRNLIFNSLPTYMGDRKKELESMGIRRHHFIFSTETAEEARRAIRAYQKGDALTGIRRIPKTNGGNA